MINNFENASISISSLLMGVQNNYAPGQINSLKSNKSQIQPQNFFCKIAEQHFCHLTTFCKLINFRFVCYFLDCVQDLFIKCVTTNNAANIYYSSFCNM